MDHEFYDVKTKSKIKTKVLECVTYNTKGRTSYAFRGETPDGRSLTAFVSQKVWEKANAGK